MTTARDLFAAARADAPDAAQRADMFQKIAMTTGVAAAASLAPGAASAAAKATVAATGGAAGGAGTALVVKLVSVGVVLGAATTGVVVVLTSSSSGLNAPITQRATPRVADRVASGAKRASTVVRRRDPSTLEDDDDDDAPASAVAAVAAPVVAPPPPESDLAEEARLVTAARRALVAGDPGRALSLVQTTRKLGARSLEPEELGLEARALRALGRADDAAATELVLKRRYPDSALAR